MTKRSCLRAARTMKLVCTAGLLSSLAVSAHAAPPARSAVSSTDATKQVSHAELDGQGASAPIGPEEHARRMTLALAQLKRADASDLEQALRSLEELRGRGAADAIVARLKNGLPPQLMERAIDVLGELRQPVASALLSELTLHRRWQIREKAIVALAALQMRSSVSVLLYALDDPSTEVRSAAARALGKVGDPRARPALNAALARGVDGALEGLAHLYTSTQVDAILTRAQANLSAAEPALWVLLSRPNLPPVTKHKIIQFLHSHESKQEAQQLLGMWRERLKGGGDARVLAALQQADERALAKTEPAAAKATESKLSQVTTPAVKGAKP